MAALQTFDQALADSTAASGHDWSDERFDVAGELASKLSDEELGLLRVIWPVDRCSGKHGVRRSSARPASTRPSSS